MALEHYYVGHFPESRYLTKNSEEKFRHHASEKCRGGWQLGVDGVTAAGVAKCRHWWYRCLGTGYVLYLQSAEHQKGHVCLVLPTNPVGLLSSEPLL
jgi:hypothetical protein